METKEPTDNKAEEPQKIYPHLNNQVLRTLQGIQEPNGMRDLYVVLLEKVVTLILVHGEEIGLDDSTALSYIRILRMLRDDIHNLCRMEDDSEENDDSEFHPL